MMLTILQLKRILLMTILKTKWIPTTSSMKEPTTIAKVALTTSNGTKMMITIECMLTCACTCSPNPKCGPASHSSINCVDEVAQRTSPVEAGCNAADSSTGILC